MGWYETELIIFGDTELSSISTTQTSGHQHRHWAAQPTYPLARLCLSVLSHLKYLYAACLHNGRRSCCKRIWYWPVNHTSVSVSFSLHYIILNLHCFFAASSSNLLPTGEWAPHGYSQPSHLTSIVETSFTSMITIDAFHLDSCKQHWRSIGHHKCKMSQGRKQWHCIDGSVRWVWHVYIYSK